MALADLTKAERRVVFECLRAAAEGPFFPDWEFHTLFGLERVRVAEIAAAWPPADSEERDVWLAINNAMNNLLGYPHGQEAAWRDHISVDSAEVERIFAKWKYGFRGHSTN